MRANRAIQAVLLSTMLCAILLPAAVPTEALIIDLKTSAPDYLALGAAADDFTAQSVVFGDVNGDGRSDTIIGARGVDYSGRTSCGVIYVVLSSDTLVSPVDLSLARDDLVRIYGPAADAQLGARVASGDLNGDGRDEIVCGVPSAGPNGKFSAGEVYIVYGADTPPSLVDLASPGPGVTVVQGENIFDKLGESVAVGDVNGDLVGDILAGAPFATVGGRSLAGALFVLYGDADLALTQTIDLAVTPWAGVRVWGSRANDVFGTACMAADVTGDGTDDILVGAPQAAAPGRVSAGIAYLIPGGPSLPGTIDTLDDAAPVGVKFLGAAADALNGSAFGAADTDGDFATDLLIAAPQFSPAGRAGAGAVYCLNGAAAFPDTVDLATPPASVTRIEGPAAGFKIGRSLAAGDLNFDGMDDVVIGVPEASPLDPVTFSPRSQAGTAYIVFGRGVLPAVLDLAAEQTGLTTIAGAAALDRTGNSVAVGRFDGDAFDDLLLGAYTASRDGAFSVGKAALLLGSPAITPTVVVFFDASAEAGRVRLEWTLRDDVSPDAFVVYRAAGSAAGDGERLPSNGFTRLGPARYSYEDAAVRAGGTYTYTVEIEGAEPQTLFSTTLTVPLFAAAALHPGAPNPFRDRTALAFDIPASGRVALRIYDVRGALVASVTDAEHVAGTTTLFWDGRDVKGARVPSGVYFARMEYAGRAYERKVLIVR